MDNIKSSLNPPIIAHRGASAQAPENTAAAFIKAKQLGLHWVEFDVMLASTGEAIIFHDEDLERTTNGKGQLLSSQYLYLKNLDVGSWFNPAFSKERILTLEDALELFHAYQLAANLEIKPLPGQEPIIVKRVFEILSSFAGKLPQPLLISSFSPEVLKQVRKISSECLIGVLIDEWQDHWEAFCREVKATSVNMNQNILTEARVKEIKKHPYLLLTYTVNHLERAQQLLSWGVDAIFSDCPDSILKGFNVKP